MIEEELLKWLQDITPGVRSYSSFNSSREECIILHILELQGWCAEKGKCFVQSCRAGRCQKQDWNLTEVSLGPNSEPITSKVRKSLRIWEPREKIATGSNH